MKYLGFTIDKAVGTNPNFWYATAKSLYVRRNGKLLRGTGFYDPKPTNGCFTTKKAAMAAVDLYFSLKAGGK